MKSAALVFVAILSLYAHALHADFAGPRQADQAISPNGDLLVRMKPDERTEEEQDAPRYTVTYYAYDANSDTFAKRSSFVFDGYLSEMLYVSNTGDLAFVSLGVEDAIRLYSPEGKHVRTWHLTDFLSKKEVKGCAQTGATLQWLEEASFADRTLRFRGPSQVIRALEGSYTVMRGVDRNVHFSGEVDAEAAKLIRSDRDKAIEPCD